MYIVTCTSVVGASCTLVTASVQYKFATIFFFVKRLIIICKQTELVIVFTDQTRKPHVNAAASTNKSISVFTVRGEGVHSSVIPILPFSRKPRGPLLFLICEKGASGSDLKHTVTCLATEPRGLPESVERM